MFTWLRRTQRQHQRLLALSVSAQRVGIVVVEQRSSHQPPSVVLNDAETCSPKQLFATLQQLLQKYKRLLTSDMPCQLILAADYYQTVSIDRPRLEGDELQAGLRFAVRELVNLPPTQIIADYYDYPLQVAGADKIQVVVADQAKLQPLVDTLLATNLALQGISTAELAIARFSADHTEPFMLLSQTPGEPLLLQIMAQQQVFLSRQVRGMEFLAKVSQDELELGALDNLTVELQRSLDYYQAQLRQPSLRQIITALPLATPVQAKVNSVLQNALGIESRAGVYPAWCQELASGDYTDLAALGGSLLLADSMFEMHDGAAREAVA